MNVKTFEEVTQPSMDHFHRNRYDPDHIRRLDVAIDGI